MSASGSDGPDDDPARPSGSVERIGDETRDIEFTATATFGPLPSPETLAKYHALSPDLVESIVTMAETEGAHRRDIESRELDHLYALERADQDDRRRGQLFGFVIGMTAIVTGAVLTILDQPWVGVAIGTGGIIGLVTVFVQGRRAGSAGDEVPEE